MPLGFLPRRTVLPLLRGRTSCVPSTALNGHIVQAPRLHVANASRFARRVNSGKLPAAKVPENAPQTVESWSSRASVPPRKGSWKPVIILLYLAGPCTALYTYFTLKPVRFDAEHWEIHQGKKGEGKRRVIDFAEVQKHNSKETGVWVVIHDQVYDLTPFLDKHPGGARVILAHAGTDATQIFSRLHSNNVLSVLKPEQRLGFVDPETLPKETLDPDEERMKRARANMPPLSSLLSLKDIEKVARSVMSSTAWSFYRSSAEDDWAYLNNLAAFNFYWFRPRVMRPVAVVDPSTTILGIPTPLPIFVSPAAMAGLGHPEGECNITRGAGAMGIIQGVSAHASRSIEDIAAARRDGQVLFYQLYLHKDRSRSEKIIRDIDNLGFKAVILTVDCPVVGKREQEVGNAPLVKDDLGMEEVMQSGIAASLSTYFEANLQWSDVTWLKSLTKLPILVKGIQTVEDVELAVQHGASGVILSNHGGRQLDYAPASIDVLYELRQRRPDLFAKTEVYIDGGIRRGTDVLKAIALGAKAVGLGRPFLFANGAYGELGIVKVIRILEDEISTNMRLLGVRTLDELTPDMVQYMDRTPPRRERQ